MHDTLVLLTVVEIVLLVVVLALALIRIQSRLRIIADGLARLGADVGAVEGHVALITPFAPKLNAPLEDIVGALPAIAEMAETVAARSKS